MANWCSNTITFIGDETKVKHLIKGFEIMDERDLNKYPLLLENETMEKGFVGLYVDGSEQVAFETKWSPDPVYIIKIANLFGVDFELEYEELSEGLYGVFKYDYENKTLTDRCLQDIPEYSEDDSYFDELSKLLDAEEDVEVGFDLATCQYYSL